MLLTEFCDSIRKQLNKLNEFEAYYYFLSDSCLEEIRYSERILRTLLAIIEKEESDRLTSHHVELLIDFLKDRWGRIKNTNLSYPHASELKITHLCFYIADVIHRHGDGDYSIFKILIPTLEVEENVYSLTSLHEKEKMRLNYFVLTDDNKRYIDVIDCLNFAEKDGVLCETTGGKIPRVLSVTEVARIIRHSRYAREYYELIAKRIMLSKSGPEMALNLQKLRSKFREGDKNNSGSETTAGLAAYEGILEFTKYLETLSEKDKQFLFSLSTSDKRGTSNIYSFGEIWNEITHYDPISSPIKCVYGYGTQIDNILDDNPILFGKSEDGKSMDDLSEEIKKKRKALENAIVLPNYVVKSGYSMGAKINTMFPEFLVNELTSIDQLIYLLEFLPKASRNAVLKKFEGKFASQLHATSDDISKLLSLLPSNLKIPFIESLEKDFFKLVKEDKALLRILDSLSKEERYDFIKSNFKYCIRTIKSGDALSEFLALAPNEEDFQIRIIKDIGPRLRDIITSPEALKNIFSILSPKNRAEVIEIVYLNILSFKLSLRDVNRYILLIDHTTVNRKQLKQFTLKALEAYNDYPTIHKQLLIVVNRAFQNTTIEKKSKAFLGKYYIAETDYKIIQSQQLERALHGKMSFFGIKKPKGRVGAMVKYAKNHFRA